MRRAHLQRGAHDDQEVCQRKVCQVLEEVTWKLLPKEHNVGLDHALTGGTPGNRPTHHIRLMGRGKKRHSIPICSSVFKFTNKMLKTNVINKASWTQWQKTVRMKMKRMNTGVRVWVKTHSKLISIISPEAHGAGGGGKRAVSLHQHVGRNPCHCTQTNRSTIRLRCAVFIYSSGKTTHVFPGRRCSACTS